MLVAVLIAADAVAACAVARTSASGGVFLWTLVRGDVFIYVYVDEQVGQIVDKWCRTCRHAVLRAFVFSQFERTCS